MKAVEKIINGNWNLLIKDGNNILIRISAPNELNYQTWRISLQCGICYDYKGLSDAINCLQDIVNKMYHSDVSKIKDAHNYPCTLLMCFQDELVTI